MNRLLLPFFQPLCSLLLICLISCSPYADLDRLAEEIHQSFPAEDYDQPLSRPDTVVYYQAGRLEDHLRQLDRFRSQLNTMQPEEHWKPNRKVLHQELQSYLNRLQAYFFQFQTDPSIYNLGGKIQQQLVSDTLTKQQKVAYIQKNLRKATPYYLNARSCLIQPPPERIRLAVQKQRAGLQLLEGPLPDSLKAWELRQEQMRSINRQKYVAGLAMKDYIAFCNSLLFEAKEDNMISLPADR